jgi:hypothetical protein
MAVNTIKPQAHPVFIALQLFIDSYDGHQQVIWGRLRGGFARFNLCRLNFDSGEE